MYVFLDIHRYYIYIHNTYMCVYIYTLLVTHKNIYKNTCKNIYKNNEDNFLSLMFLFSGQNQLSLGFIAAGMSLQCSTVKN